MTTENVAQNHNQLIDPSHVVEVPMKSWESSDATHTVLFSHGLGPCIGITVYDPLAKKGFMGHIADPVLQRGTIEEMFEAVRHEVSDPSQLKIWVRGGQAGNELDSYVPEINSADYYLQLGKSNSNLQARKETVAECIDELVGHDQSRVDIKYDDRSMLSGFRTMQRLDTVTGEFVSHAYSAGEYQMALGVLSLSNIVQPQGEQ